MRHPMQPFIDKILRRSKPERILFCYGSLLRGESNHHVMAHCRFVGPARTAPLYRLLDLGPYPALVSGGEVAIAGELYSVDDEALARIDRFEGHPHHYRRTPIRLGGGGGAESYLLVAPRRADAAEIASGDWRAHRRARGPVRGT